MIRAEQAPDTAHRPEIRDSFSVIFHKQVEFRKCLDPALFPDFVGNLSGIAVAICNKYVVVYPDTEASCFTDQNVPFTRTAYDNNLKLGIS
jgi:hypothetical protein